jgi:hypothetical protein
MNKKNCHDLIRYIDDDFAYVWHRVVTPAPKSPDMQRRASWSPNFKSL